MSNTVYTCENEGCPNYHEPLYNPGDGKCSECGSILKKQSTQEREKGYEKGYEKE